MGVAYFKSVIFKEPGLIRQSALILTACLCCAGCRLVSLHAFSNCLCKSKKDGNDQETIQSSTTPDSGYHKWKLSSVHYT